jgi:hypothetical protein
MLTTPSPEIRIAIYKLVLEEAYEKSQMQYHSSVQSIYAYSSLDTFVIDHAVFHVCRKFRTEAYDAFVHGANVSVISPKDLAIAIKLLGPFYAATISKLHCQQFFDSRDSRVIKDALTMATCCFTQAEIVVTMEKIDEIRPYDEKTTIMKEMQNLFPSVKWDTYSTPIFCNPRLCTRRSMERLISKVRPSVGSAPSTPSLTAAVALHSW